MKTSPAFKVVLLLLAQVAGAAAPAMAGITRSDTPLPSPPKPALPAPGIYLAKPYSMLVIVPKAGDVRMVQTPPAQMDYKMRFQERSVILEPWKGK